MLLTLDDEHKEHLGFLKDMSIDVVREFGKISVDFIKKGVNPKMYTSAAQKLGVDPEDIQHSVQGLMYLFSEAAKQNLKSLDFHDSVLTLGFSEDAVEELLQQYVNNHVELREVLIGMSPDLPHYHNLQWRLDIQLASRSLHHQVEPQVLMKLHIRDKGKDKIVPLQTDPVNLLHLTQTLDNALQELKSAHCRRILRNI